MRFASRFAAIAGVVTVALAAAPSAAAFGPGSYVALGDSYSSGVGAGSYLSASGSCERSTRAFSQLWANAHASISYVSVACAGAKTADVTATQLPVLTSGTTLISITVGGNDVGFSTVMQDCVLDGTATCVSEVNAAETQARTVLPGRLDAVYAQIRSRSPWARVVVLGYPRLYDLSAWWCVGLSSTSRSKINEGADVLDSVISQEAAKYRFAFGDVRGRFAAGHEICDGSSWLHSVDWADLQESYHPTASGQSGGYLPAFSALAN
jgi:lysophospholipase L1-like esterase